MAAKAEPITRVDNERVRVIEWRFQPGAATGFHRHEYDYVIVPLNPGRLRLIAADGSETTSELTPGNSYFKQAGVEHDVIYEGEGPFAFVEVELKQ